MEFKKITLQKHFLYQFQIPVAVYIGMLVEWIRVIICEKTQNQWMERWMERWMDEIVKEKIDRDRQKYSVRKGKKEKGKVK